MKEYIQFGGFMLSCWRTYTPLGTYCSKLTTNTEWEGLAHGLQMQVAWILHRGKNAYHWGVYLFLVNSGQIQFFIQNSLGLDS
jgi:hypothetical protein